MCYMIDVKDGNGDGDEVDKNDIDKGNVIEMKWLWIGVTRREKEGRYVWERKKKKREEGRREKEERREKGDQNVSKA